MELYRLKQTEDSLGDKNKTECFVSRYEIAFSKWAGGGQGNILVLSMNFCLPSALEVLSIICTEKKKKWNEWGKKRRKTQLLNKNKQKVWLGIKWNGNPLWTFSELLKTDKTITFIKSIMVLYFKYLFSI